MALGGLRLRLHLIAPCPSLIFPARQAKQTQTGTGDPASMHRVFTSRRYAADMTFRQPLRAVPVKPGTRYRSRAAKKTRNQVATYLGGAALLGAVLGTASIATAPGGFNTLASAAKPIAVSLGLIRARAPQEGDYWPGCNAARAAGTTPIYIGEPGYREGMDGDGDGVACEPYRGM